jgi:16S rRNA (adenine1518-N6/adenine1519-N6)-dimethyltransferase
VTFGVAYAGLGVQPNMLDKRDGHRARKRFGQHFLVDKAAIERIVSFVEPLPGDVVVEVGPGRGALTRRLLARLGQLTAVEIDRDLTAMLRDEFSADILHLIESDILRVGWGDMLPKDNGQKLFMVGNLPYNITAPFLFKALEEIDHLRTAVLMLQREVARRLAARPGSKEYGQITVLLAMRAEITSLLDVDRRSFRPVPGVDSSVIKVDFSEEPRYAVKDEGRFATLVRAAFSQRRKMLRNSLRSLTAADGRDLLPALEDVSGIDLTRRPEQLAVEEFALLSDSLATVRSESQ